MNAPSVARLDRLQAALPWLCAAGLPLAFYLKAYDPALIKDITLQAAAWIALGVWLARALEAGRFELPARRVAIAAVGAALLVWTALSFAWNPYPAVSLFPALRQIALLTLFLTSLVGPASTGWTLALADWSLAAVGVAAAYALLQRLGLDPLPWKDAFGSAAFGTLDSPARLAALCAAAWPLAMGRACDPEAGLGRRVLAGATGLLAAKALWASGSIVGAGLLAVGSAAFAALALSSSRDVRVRKIALAQAAIAAAICISAISPHPNPGASLPQGGRGSGAPVVIAESAFGAEHWLQAKRALAASWLGAVDMVRMRPVGGFGAGSFAAAFPDFRPPELARWTASAAQLAHPRSEPLRIAAELGLVGLGLALALALLVLVPGWRDARRRLARGDARSGALAAGLWAGCAALLAAGLVTDALASPAAGFWLAALSAGLAVLAREEGSSVVHVLPIPAPPAPRRWLARFAGGLAAAAILMPASFLVWDLRLNAGVLQARRGEPAKAIEQLGRVRLCHERGAAAHYLAARLIARRNGPGDAETALRLYRSLAEADPGLPQLALRTAEAQIHLLDWKGAEESLQLAARKEPSVDVFEHLVEVEWILKDPEKARQAALALVRLEPNAPEHWRLLAQTYRRLDRRAVAKLMNRHAAKIVDTAQSESLPPAY
ncbi:MAG: hypothetical protein NTX64_02070 [Elusimicrobia bacterium]|nr:hypothetical protein [Elusimicrobiota bacterium]